MSLSRARFDEILLDRAREAGAVCLEGVAVKGSMLIAGAVQRVDALSLADGSHQRLATLSAGMSFGEMVMLGSRARSASVHADTPVRSWTLSARALDELALDHPEIKIAILKNLSLDLAHKLRQANQLIGVLAA